MSYFEISRKVFWVATVLGVLLLASVAATWPLVAHFTTAIPLGTEQELTVPVFNLWTLWWTAESAARGFQGYWNAPFFHPTEGVFAYSEPQLVAGLLVAPLWKLGLPPAAIYNLAVLGLLALNGLFSYRLTRALGIERTPSLLAGLLAVTLPVVAKHHGVLPLLPLFGIPWTLEGLVRLGRSGRLAAASYAALGYVALFLSSQQLALMFAPFALAACILACGLQRYRPLVLLRIGGFTVGVGLLIFFASAPSRKYLERHNFGRSEEIVKTLSASPVDFLVRPAHALFQIPPPASPDFGDTAGLFPGIILLCLVTAGGGIALRRKGPPKWMFFLVATICGAGILALGLNLSLAGWPPFATLRDLVPGFEQLRSPYRFSLVMQIMMPPLAAFGLAAVKKKITGRGGTTLIVALGILAAAENLSIPAALQALPTSPRRPWTEWLELQPAGTVVAHIPFPGGFHVSDYATEAQRLFAQMHHRQPLVNGYSGFFSPHYTRLQGEMAGEFPSRRLLCVLRHVFEVDLLVIDQGWLAAHASELLAEESRSILDRTYTDDSVEIYRLVVPAIGCERELQGSLTNSSIPG